MVRVLIGVLALVSVGVAAPVTTYDIMGTVRPLQPSMGALEVVKDKRPVPQPKGLKLRVIQ